MQIIKPQYRYAFAYLAPRDQVVFNSIVGLLFGRTQAQWLQVTEGSPDLLVLGADSAAGTAFVGASKAVLRVSPRVSLGEAMSIHWPLRANEVQASLDQAARLLASGNRVTAATRYQLQRWPAYELLKQHPAHLRLATLLATRALSLADLSARTGVPIALCEHFLGVLLATQTVCAEAPESLSTPPIEPPVLGFFARLRAHIGLPVTREASR